MKTATVSAPVATLWATPDAPRPVLDAIALEPQGDPREWVSGLDDDGRIYRGILTQLLHGEPVLVEEVSQGWARVVATAQPAAKLDPRGYPGWLPLHQLKFDDAVEIARGWLGTPYVWGGLTPHGIDCSGLVHLAFRQVGLTLPRDADDQARATTLLAPGSEQRGDLYFFAEKAAKVTHVGFVTSPGRMLHACSDAGRVVEEELPTGRRATLVGAHRVG
ncbi:C40 family peptidase [Allorhizocola rhizosphaerae]|uniref:C40 family peptidase n=1 Tax=Allorhizocola rhizosphaerae TaxID=1872709 RepID=UPI000E3C1CA3|nr:C40 family peptidase [Allorhizocola rhizosphaerae]